MDRKPHIGSPQAGDVIRDPELLMVLGALADPSVPFRTFQGISNSTGLDTERIEVILAERPDLVRGPLSPDKTGRVLVTLATRRPDWWERWNRLHEILGTW